MRYTAVFKIERTTLFSFIVNSSFFNSRLVGRADL
jgi:hypothetical protein